MRKEATKEEWKKLYSLAESYKSLKPWMQFYGTDLFCIKFSAEESGYFTIMGKLGESIGLSLYQGMEGYNDFMGLMNAESLSVPTDYIMIEQNCISMYCGDREDLTKQQHEVIKELGLKFRGKGNWIYFETYEKGYFPYLPDRNEVVTFTQYLERLVEALNYYIEQKCNVDFDSGKIFEYAFEDGVWKGKEILLPYTEYRYRTITLNNDIMAAKLKKAAMSKKSGILELDMFYIVAPIADEKYKKPFLGKYVIMGESRSGLILDQQILTPLDDDLGALPGMLVQWIQSHGAPEAVVVSNPVMKALVSHICNICSIPLRIDRLPAIEECRAGLGDMNAQASDNPPEDISMEEFEYPLQLLGELGVDVEDWKRKAKSMETEEFAEAFQEQMLQVIEGLGFTGEEALSVWNKINEDTE